MFFHDLILVISDLWIIHILNTWNCILRIFSSFAHCRHHIQRCSPAFIHQWTTESAVVTEERITKGFRSSNGDRLIRIHIWILKIDAIYIPVLINFCLRNHLNLLPRFGYIIVHRIQRRLVSLFLDLWNILRNGVLNWLSLFKISLLNWILIDFRFFHIFDINHRFCKGRYNRSFCSYMSNLSLRSYFCLS